MTAFIDFFDVTHNELKTHSWKQLETVISDRPEEFAAVVADEIVKYRCQGAMAIHSLWYEKAFSGVEHNQQEVVKPFIVPDVGTPESPKPDDHLEGMIGEHLWFFFMRDLEHVDGEAIYVEGPGLSVTEGGGDGFLLHKNNEGDYLFRLWELKKNSGKQDVSSTIGTAYNQLKERAPAYLAKISMQGASVQQAAEKEIYSNLVQKWLQGDPQAAVGVHCATCLSKKPKKCFSTMGDQFPAFVEPKRLYGMLTVVEEFVGFAKRVRGVLWNGL